MLADVAVHMALQDKGRTSTFDATGHGSNVYQVVSQENWEIALDRAVKDLLFQLPAANGFAWIRPVRARQRKRGDGCAGRFGLITRSSGRRTATVYLRR